MSTSVQVLVFKNGIVSASPLVAVVPKSGIVDNVAESVAKKEAVGQSQIVLWKVCPMVFTTGLVLHADKLEAAPASSENRPGGLAAALTQAQA